MELTIAIYNMEWMVNLFSKEGIPKTDGDDGERSRLLADVVKAMDPDIIGIVEGPDTTVSGSKLASEQLEAWAALHGLDSHYKGVHGFPSGGRQELCALYRSDKVTVTHNPVLDQSKDPFNETFIVDTTDSLIKEQYKHYRPPLELSVSPAAGGDELARIIVAHAKSKGIFDNVDLARYEQISARNRKKLYAECMSIRNRVDQWFKKNPDTKIIVMGDINDGFGMDYYEQRFSRSAVEILLGDIWQPERILKHVLPKPKLGKYGWTPSTSRFQDKLTEDKFNVLIDHILVSRNIDVHDVTVWNPYLDQKNDVKNETVDSIKFALKNASDHFPVSITVGL